jgi:hypothetical protein
LVGTLRAPWPGSLTGLPARSVHHKDTFLRTIGETTWTLTRLFHKYDIIQVWNFPSHGRGQELCLFLTPSMSFQVQQQSAGSQPVLDTKE